MKRCSFLHAAAILAVLFAGAPIARADLVTFANFAQDTPGNQWSFTNNGFPGTATFTANTPVQFQFLADPAGSGTVPVGIDFLATAVLSSSTIAPALSFPVGGQLFLVQPMTGPNTLSFTRVSDGANLLSVTFFSLGPPEPSLQGLQGSSVAGLTASTLSQHIVLFTSEFIDFTDQIDGGLSLSFSSVTPTLLLEGASGTNFLRSFMAAGTGTFDVDLPPIPEPATSTLLIIGALGLMGYGWRQRRALATAQAS